MPAVAALLTLLVGLLDIGSALTPEWRVRLAELRGVLPGSVSRQAAAFTVVVGVLLVLISRGLRRRKRRALRAVVVLLAASVVLQVAKGLDYEEAMASAALLVALVVTRREFSAKGDPATRWRALGVGAVLVGASVMVGMVLLWLRASRIVGPHPLSAQLEHVLYGLVGITGPLRFVSDRFADLVTRILLTLGLVTIAATAYLALRPPQPRPSLTADDETRVRALLARHGAADSLGYFALRRDKSVIWSPTGKACVAYRVVSGVMLASGDPLGDSEAWPGAISQFLAEAADHAWTPAVIGCSEAGGTAYSRAGLSALEFGDEAVVDAADFTLQGRAMRNVRQAVGRVERAGYTHRACRMRDVDAAERARLKAQAAAWRGTETERGFSMALGRLGDLGDGDCVALMAFSDGGACGPVLRGLLHFVPWGPDGLSLDAMLRDTSADNGLNEFLIVSALRSAGELGIRRVSLNFAFLRSALERGERLGAGPVSRAWRGLLLFLSRWFQIDSLYRFNAKFQPRWQPRYVAYPSTRDLPRIALAMLEAEAFLVRPRPAFVARRRRAWPYPGRGGEVDRPESLPGP
ncbi:MULTISPECIES: phosphatidylglycerol lysyltransferase domain-containing protein [unclassified Frankia]|uniref:phosphatidylglycerol lysyltransferase domain-containing protein n=1 Tax=unclassified Frankia TaxID=2632575 RepID=UPI0027DE5672|nr:MULTISPECIES: phosphatidylglycerol lysyltransferase domain-containing protein [unclassified Frankia]